MNTLLAAALALSALSLPCHAGNVNDLKPIGCGDCAAWSKPQQPFNIVGNTWYVGPAGLSSVLITGPQGHILVDGTLPEAAQQIVANIRALGFRIEDVRLIVNSHAHFDHAGGIAYLARRSGAQVAAGAAAVPVLESGKADADDPQYGYNKERRMAKVAHVHGVRDGEVLSVGALRITAHATPGHTRGSTTWSWRACEADGGVEHCYDVVFADSLSAISAPGFRYGADARHPDLVPSFRTSIAKVGALPCDVVISAHPGGVDLLEKAAARTPDHNPFIAPGGCRAYADTAARGLDERIEQERRARP